MILMISGKQGSGKTTTSDLVADELRAQQFQVVRMRFAEAIYEMHDLCLGVLDKYGIKRPNVKIDGPLLQLLGTEWGRNQIHQDVWVNILRNRINLLFQGMPDLFGKRIVIVDDMRFPNEFDPFESALRVRFECDRELRKARAEKWRENENHPSEIALDEYAKEGKFGVYCDTGKYGQSDVINHLVSITKHLAEGKCFDASTYDNEVKYKLK